MKEENNTTVTGTNVDITSISQIKYNWSLQIAPNCYINLVDAPSEQHRKAQEEAFGFKYTYIGEVDV